MAHYAFLDQDNRVTDVIVGRDESNFDWETYYSMQRGQACKRTSYSGGMRKNYAGIGYTYDAVRDAFIPPQPHPSWVLDEATCQWQAPVPYPNDGAVYVWNEVLGSWVNSGAT